MGNIVGKIKILLRNRENRKLRADLSPHSTERNVVRKFSFVGSFSRILTWHCGSVALVTFGAGDNKFFCLLEQFLSN